MLFLLQKGETSDSCRDQRRLAHDGNTDAFRKDRILMGYRGFCRSVRTRD